MEKFDVRTTERIQLLEITETVQEKVSRSAHDNGICLVYCPHTTAGITINENADPDVVHDMLLWFNRTIPYQQPLFRHGEGNSDSHIKASLVGSSVTLIVQKRKLVLGRWQGIYFCEFDGPRERHVHLQLLLY